MLGCLTHVLSGTPSETHAAINMTSLRAIDGDTSYHSGRSFSFKVVFYNAINMPSLDILLLHLFSLIAQHLFCLSTFDFSENS